MAKKHMKEMSRSPIGGNANQNHSEITLHTQLGWLLLKKKAEKRTSVLVRMCGNSNCWTQLVGM